MSLDGTTASENSYLPAIKEERMSQDVVKDCGIDERKREKLEYNLFCPGDGKAVFSTEESFLRDLFLISLVNV